MQQHITPVRIANSLQQDSSFNGVYVLVEGDTDNKLYKKLTLEENTKIKVTFGKKKMRETYDILEERGFSRMMGIRDADFIRLNKTGKFDINYDKNIFITDFHDTEVMMIDSDAFDSFIHEVSLEENILKFTENKGNIRDYIYSLVTPIACLRLANKIHDLGLAFKPVRPEGNKLKFKKFICEKEIIYLGHDKLINTVIEYSTNRGSAIAHRDYILEKLNEIINERLPEKEIFNGHDLAETIYIVCKKGLKSTHEALNNATCVESMFRLAYNKADFSKTKLYIDLVRYQENEKIYII
ncbi:DUF4435 domain-containing protein [Aeromonas salmonicida]|uniref:Uncharacterized protein DUF4435 n=1 Tax=Aeromonas salmonicida TaxID=645 RepID=A0AAX1PNZ5_AERSA|nr:DUF4435 domain-containing protein [Aeromonas salmonicida]RAJ09886.1 uncharacterized protein DUF4435 [Aeromonas salmonicida]